uniref:Major facilitator superfamily (MFS) profile domain-containing protein n=1 Tax=Haptolina ericina TaxID=156174 RepID=A0A7S3ALW1_9EUKA
MPALPQHSLPLIISSFTVFGAGAGLTVAPASNLMVRAVTSRGLSIEEAGDQLGSLSTIAYSLGASVGPLAGGLIVQHLGGPLQGYRWLCTILAFITAASALVLTLIFVANDRSSRRAVLRMPLVDAAADDGSVLGASACTSTSITDSVQPQALTQDRQAQVQGLLAFP